MYNKQGSRVDIKRSNNVSWLLVLILTYCRYIFLRTLKEEISREVNLKAEISHQDKQIGGKMENETCWEGPSCCLSKILCLVSCCCAESILCLATVVHRVGVNAWKLLTQITFCHLDVDLIPHWGNSHITAAHRSEEKGKGKEKKAKKLN